MNKTDFSKLPIDTEVYSFMYGWGVIMEHLTENKKYTVKCKFHNNNMVIRYTNDGKDYDVYISPTLFLNAFDIPDSAFKPPRPDIRLDQRILVSTDGVEWRKRHFSGWSEEDKVQTFANGRTSWSTYPTDEHKTTWEYYKLNIEEE